MAFQDCMGIFDLAHYRVEFEICFQSFVNKGIYNNNYELYTVFTDRIAVLNKNVYNILDYFKNKK